MTDEQAEHAIKQLLQIATAAAQLASQVSLVLHRTGLLSPELSERWAMVNRHLGELLEQAGQDEIASDFGATAALLRQPPPSRG